MTVDSDRNELLTLKEVVMTHGKNLIGCHLELTNASPHYKKVEVIDVETNIRRNGRNNGWKVHLRSLIDTGSHCWTSSDHEVIIIKYSVNMEQPNFIAEQFKYRIKKVMG